MLYTCCATRKAFIYCWKFLNVLYAAYLLCYQEGIQLLLDVLKGIVCCIPVVLTGRHSASGFAKAFHKIKSIHGQSISHGHVECPNIQHDATKCYKMYYTTNHTARKAFSYCWKFLQVLYGYMLYMGSYCWKFFKGVLYIFAYVTT